LKQGNIENRHTPRDRWRERARKREGREREGGGEKEGGQMIGKIEKKRET